MRAFLQYSSIPAMLLIAMLADWIGGFGIFLGFVLYFLSMIFWIRFSG